MLVQIIHTCCNNLRYVPTKEHLEPIIRISLQMGLKGKSDGEKISEHQRWKINSTENET